MPGGSLDSQLLDVTREQLPEEVAFCESLLEALATAHSSGSSNNFLSTRSSIFNLFLLKIHRVPRFFLYKSLI